MTFGEDTATSRTGRGPANLATIRAAARRASMTSKPVAALLADLHITQQEWPDGSWRTPGGRWAAWHIVTVAPLSTRHRDIGTITVREYPGGQAVVDDVVDPVDDDTTARRSIWLAAPAAYIGCCHE